MIRYKYTQKLIRLIFGLVLTSSSLISSCKSLKPNGSEPKPLPERASDIDAGQSPQSVDKPSEESIGIPGYRLACNYEKPPQLNAPDASIQCQVTNRDKTQTLSTGDWQLESVSSALNTNLQVNEQANTANIALAATDRDLLLAETNRLLIRAKLTSGGQIEALLAELLAASPGQYRVNARCTPQFSIMLTDQLTQFFHTESNTFPSCPQVAAALQNRSLPLEPIPSPNPNRSPTTVIATCSDRSDGAQVFTLRVSLPTLNTQSILEPLPPNVCQSLMAIINELGL